MGLGKVSIIQGQTRAIGKANVRADVVPKTAFGNEAALSTSGSQRLFGVFRRRERWGLSWRGWIILLFLGCLLGVLTLLNVQPFLAQTHRVNSNILVMEGWIHDYAIHAAVEEFRGHSYQRIFTTGGPIPGSGQYVNDYQTSASVGADLLKKAGIPEDLVQMVPSRVMDRDRTYASAVALGEWFDQREPAVHGVNVITEDTHARRTRLLFQEALGKDFKVGIIAVPNPDYDARHWWRYSEGVRDVTSEAIAYLYARFFFYP
ncbi:MAG TPA: ElyC/SanA/YdcF family protein [Terriglobales bacterium]|nr:ElyC/SanA/YdcF family protein [Terriglobales bacterium]